MTPIERARALRRDYDDLTRQAQETGHYSDPPAEMVASPSLPSAHPTAGSSLPHWNASTRPENGHGQRTTCSGYSARLTRSKKPNGWPGRSTVLVKLHSPP